MEQKPVLESVVLLPAGFPLQTFWAGLLVASEQPRLNVLVWTFLQPKFVAAFEPMPVAAQLIPAPFVDEAFVSSQPSVAAVVPAVTDATDSVGFVVPADCCADQFLLAESTTGQVLNPGGQSQYLPSTKSVPASVRLVRINYPIPAELSDSVARQPKQSGRQWPVPELSI